MAILHLVYLFINWESFRLFRLLISWIMPLWMFVYKFLCEHNVFSFLGFISRNRIVGSYSNSMFNLLRNYQTVFQRGCIILHSHQQCVRFPISLQYHQHLLSSDFLIITILVSVKWYLIVVLICIPQWLMI